MPEGMRLDPDTAVEILEKAGDPVVLFDPTATIRWANAAVDRLGWTPEQLVGRSALDMLEATDLERALMAMSAISDGFRPPSSAPFHVLAADGSRVECDVAGWPLGPSDAPDGIAVHLRPTQDSRVLRHLLQRLLAGDAAPAVLGDMLDLLYHRNEHVEVLVSFLDEEGDVRVVGGALDHRLAGTDAPPGSPWDTARDTGDAVLVTERADLPDDIAVPAAAAGLADCWITPVRTDGEHIATITLWVRAGGPPAQLDTYSVALLAQLIELVLRWRRQTRDLERAATRDPLTGLPNRRALADFDERGPGRDIGVLYIDLDNFKPVNDSLGHAAGDQVLRTVANRLQSTVRSTDIVARLGGDEFGVICPGCSPGELGSLAEQVRQLLSEPIAVHADVVTVGASIGVAVGHGSVGPLLEQADTALYDAKGSGRGAICWAP